jgi:hypothetical protein
MIQTLRWPTSFTLWLEVLANLPPWTVNCLLNRGAAAVRAPAPNLPSMVAVFDVCLMWRE